MIILSWSVWVYIVIFLPAVLSSYSSYVFFFLVLPLWQFRTPNLNWTTTRQEKKIAGERDSKRWFRSGSFDEPQKKRWQRNVPDAVPNVLWYIHEAYLCPAIELLYNVLLLCNGFFFCWENVASFSNQHGVIMHHVRPCLARIPRVKAKTPSEFWSVADTASSLKQDIYPQIFWSEFLCFSLCLFMLMFTVCFFFSFVVIFHTYADIRLLVVWNLKIPPSFELQIHIILFQHGLTFLLIVSYGMLWFSNILQYWILYIENSIEDIATRLKTDTRSMFEKCVWFETQTMYLVFQGPCTEVEDVDPSPPTPERKSNLRRRRPKPLSLGS